MLQSFPNAMSNKTNSIFTTLKKFLLPYPLFTLQLTFLYLILSFTEAIGFTMVIPVFERLNNASPRQDGLSGLIDRSFAVFGVTPTLPIILAALCTAFTLKAALALTARKYSTEIAGRFIFQLRQDLFEKLSAAELRFFYGHKQGALINSIVTESIRAGNAFALLAQWLSGAFSCVLYLALALAVSPGLAILALAVGMISLYPLRFITRRAHRYGNLLTDSNEALQNELGEVFQSIKLIKGNAQEDLVKRRVLPEFEKSRRLWEKIFFNSNSIAIFAQPLAVVVLSLIIVVSLSLRIPTAELMVFLLAFVRLLPTIAQIQAFKNDIDNNAPGLDRIAELKRQAGLMRENTEGRPFAGLHEKIQAKNLFFSFSDQQPLLKDIQLEIKKSQFVAILGKSGEGKTTLVDLLLGLHRPTRGEVEYDGVALSGIDLRSLRKQVSYISQDAFLFHDTVLKNISLGQDFTDAEIQDAAILANAHSFISSMEKGYETVVGDRGTKLSGGQRQRIILARALLSKPKILILDEATSALDFESEKSFQNTLKELRARQEITLIMISHRIASVQYCDMCYVIDQGRIVEKGTWNQLVQDGRSYVSQGLG